MKISFFSNIMAIILYLVDLSIVTSTDAEPRKFQLLSVSQLYDVDAV